MNFSLKQKKFCIVLWLKVAADCAKHCPVVAVGVVLVTDAISAMGLPDGVHHVGSQSVEVRNNRAVVAGTDTLCGRYRSGQAEFHRLL